VGFLFNECTDAIGKGVLEEKEVKNEGQLNSEAIKDGEEEHQDKLRMLRRMRKLKRSTEKDEEEYVVQAKKGRPSPKRNAADEDKENEEKGEKDQLERVKR